MEDETGPIKIAGAYDDLDITTEAEAEAKAERFEEETIAGPMARPRGRRLLFGGLSSGTYNSGSGTNTAPPAFNPHACYCQMKDFPVPLQMGG